MIYFVMKITIGGRVKGLLPKRNIVKSFVSSCLKALQCVTRPCCYVLGKKCGK
jgi:hypothetical protein